MTRSRLFMTLALVTSSACGASLGPATSSGGSGGQPGTGTGGGAPTGGANGLGGAGPTGGATGSGGATGGVPGTGGASGTGGGQTGGHVGAGGVAGGHAGTMGTGGAVGGHAGVTATAGASGGGGKSGAGGLGPEAPGGQVTGFGTVLISASSTNQITRLQTEMVVPPEPPASGTLFLWPGLQPGGANFDPINNGVLQPVLTWGSSCAPGKQPRAYSTWWISGQYVNTFGKAPGYTGCQGGAVMSVSVGDTLTIDMALSGTNWTQTVSDVQTGQSVSYSIDMMNQAQNDAYFVIEGYSSAPVSPVIFTNTVLTFGSSDSRDCKLAMRGQTDYVSVPVASTDGRSCSIQEIILRAQGIQ